MQLICGDAIESMKMISDHSVDMILTDLPYGCTNNDWDKILPLNQLWDQYKRVIKEAGAILLFAMNRFVGEVISSNSKWYRYEWVWEKPNARGFLNSHYMTLKCHENILVFYKRKPTYNPQFTGSKPYVGKRSRDGSKNYRKFEEDRVVVSDGRRYPRDVLRFKSEIGYHPTQKPVPLLEYMIKTYTNPGETVLDCCMGSGSTGVAAVQMGRAFIGIEKDLDYYAIAKKRIAEAQAQG